MLLAFVSFLGYLIGLGAVPEHVTAVTVGFFFLGLMLRFMPQVFGELLSGLADLF
jgi:hypothetical protein